MIKDPTPKSKNEECPAPWRTQLESCPTRRRAISAGPELAPNGAPTRNCADHGHLRARMLKPTVCRESRSRTDISRDELAFFRQGGRKAGDAVAQGSSDLASSVHPSRRCLVILQPTPASFSFSHKQVKPKL